jgi:ADP-ribose pyrophosphatase YjhB (NUDIX family)
MAKSVFSEIIEWKEQKFKVSIYDSDKFEDLKNVKQVYGFVFNEKNEILVIRLPGKTEWCLPGGTPEEYDTNWIGTLQREVIEEADVEIEDISPCFYATSEGQIETNTPGRITIMLRAVAKVKKILPQTNDPAHGKINERKFISQSEFLDYCPWGENGKKQLELALKKLNRTNKNNKKEIERKFGLGVFVCVFNKDFSKILLIKRNAEKRKKHGADWGNIGGKLHFGERLIDACIRETQEEIGVTLDSKKVVLVEVKEKPLATEIYHTFNFAYATTLSEDEKITINEESEDYKWFELTNLPEKMLDKEEDIIEIAKKARKNFKH